MPTNDAEITPRLMHSALTTGVATSNAASPRPATASGSARPSSNGRGPNTPSTSRASTLNHRAACTTRCRACQDCSDTGEPRGIQVNPVMLLLRPNW